MTKKILLVEDEALIALNESRIIEKEGYEVLTVYSGEKAVEAVNADPDISLILMDIDLGKGISGTEAKQKELALLYSHLRENSIDAVYLLSEAGKVLNVNRVATEMIGYTRSELLRLTIDDIDPNYPAKNFIEFWRDKPGNSTLLFETLHRHKNGEIIPVEVNGIFFRLDGEKYLFGVARDIRERKKTEKVLQESEEKYRRIFENSHNLIMEVDTETYEILSCNPAMAKSIGVTPIQAEGLKIADILPPEVFKKREAYGFKALETKSIQRFVDECDGRYFQNIFIPIVENEHRMILTITTDLT